jgi:hypothetical protein
MLVMHNSQGAARGHGLEGCPTHGPHVVGAVKEGSYVARCLACGLVGPGRQDGGSETSLRPEMALGYAPVPYSPECVE